jgi:hypothetical protein
VGAGAEQIKADAKVRVLPWAPARHADEEALAVESAFSGCLNAHKDYGFAHG